MYSKSRLHFTLIEILVVVGVIAILMGAAVGVSSYVSRRNADARTLATVEMIRIGLEQYKAKYGFYPPTIQIQANGYIPFCLDVFSPNADKDSNPERMIQNNFNQFIDINLLSQQKYSDKTDVSGGPAGSVRCQLKDGYGEPIYYRCPGYVNKTAYDLGSLGADGKLGDESAAAVTASTAGNDFGKGDDITNCRR